MKKLILAFLIMTATVVTVDAQTMVTGGYRRAGTNEEIKAMQVDKIKSTLHITEAQAENVDAIQQDYKLKMRAIKMDSQYTDEERKTKLDAVKAARKQKLSAILSAQQIAALDGAEQHQKNKKSKTGIIAGGASLAPRRKSLPALAIDERKRSE